MRNFHSNVGGQYLFIDVKLTDSRGIARAPQTSKMENFAIIVNG